MSKGFYSYNDNDLFYAPNAVLNRNFELHKEKFEEYTYPINGWYWFNSEEEAKQFFKIENDTNDIVDNT